MSNVPDSPSCRACNSSITMQGYEVFAEARQRCQDSNGDICAECCPQCQFIAQAGGFDEKESAPSVECTRCGILTSDFKPYSWGNQCAAYFDCSHRYDILEMAAFRLGNHRLNDLSHGFYACACDKWRVRDVTRNQAVLAHAEHLAAVRSNGVGVQS